MTTYSSGPWSAETRDYDHTWDVLDGNGDHIANVPNPFEHLGDRDDLVAVAAPQTEATARLIAAAPELLKAAKRALATLRAAGHRSEQGNVLGALERAIAKAEGR